MDTTPDTATLVDFITNRSVPNTGAEENRQAVERFLVEQKGYAKEDIEVDTPIALEIEGAMYRSGVDLTIRASGNLFMCIKCAAGSLGSREREIVAAARLLTDVQVPFAAVSDGKTAVVLETVSGKKIAEGMSEIFNRDEAAKLMAGLTLVALPEERRRRESLIFRSYDSMNVNRALKSRP